MTPQDDATVPSLLGFDGGADGLLDRIELGIRFSAPGAFQDVVRQLEVQNLLPEKRLGGRADRASFQVGSYSDSPLLGAGLIFSGKISLVATAAGVRATDASQISANPLRTLRDQIEPVCDIPPGCGDNVVGPGVDASELRNLLGLQLDSMRRALSDLFDVLHAADADVEMRVREAEVCRDLAVADPVASVHLLSRSTNPFTAVTRATPFSGDAIVEGAGNAMVVRWHDGRKSNPVRYKFYPKGPWLRCEVAYMAQTAVARAVGRPGQGSPWCRTPEEVEDVLRQVAAAASPDLDIMEAHLSTILESTERGVAAVDVIRLSAALAPLGALADGLHGGRGRPMGAPQRALADEILHQLLLNGRYDIRGVGAGDPIRRALTAACETGLVAIGGERGSLYSIVPEMEGARLGIASAVAEGRAAGVPPQRLPARRLRLDAVDEGEEDGH